MLSLRPDRNGDEWIRVSPHWTNLPRDLDELAAHIGRLAQAQI
jgi:hypothetical protein